jgi:hypothetical protein
MSNRANPRGRIGINPQGVLQCMATAPVFAYGDFAITILAEAV